MRVKPVQLRTPLGDEVLALKAGDHVELSGIVYTARDEAHLRMQGSRSTRKVQLSTTAARLSWTKKSLQPAPRLPPV